MKAIVSLLCLGVAGVSQALVIDDFSTGDFVATFSSDSNSSFSGNAATVPGGSRYWEIEHQSNPFGMETKMEVGNGFLYQSVSPLTDAAGAVAYGHFNIFGSDLNIDLSAYDAITVDVLFNDLSADFRLDIFVTGTGWVSGGLHNVGPVSFGSPVTVVLPFSELGISMADVDGIAIRWDGVMANDIVLDNIQAVPEPVSLGVLAVGLGLVARRRRK